MKYAAANNVRVYLQFNKQTDADILAILEQVKADGGTVQGFIKKIIRNSANNSAETEKPA